MTILITLIVFILLILVMIWGHFLKQVKQNSIDIDLREQTNKDLYHEHKAEIESDFEQQKIDEENYQYLLAELDKGFIQDMEENQTQFVGDTQQRLSIVWPLAISLFILITSFFLYQKVGAFALLSQPQITEQSQIAQAQQNNLGRIEALKEQLTQTPDNSALWYTLGQELVVVGAFDAALLSFDKAIAIEGNVADLIGAKAQAAYYQNNQQITPQVQQFIDQALAIDADDASTNILLGMHAFSLTNYEEAIQYWQRMVDVNTTVNAIALTDAINEAKRRLGSLSNGVSTEANADSSLSTPANQNEGLSINVTLSEDIRNRLNQGNDLTVFVYAIPSSGPRIPVAAVKMNTSDLPTTVILNDSNAMNPEMTLSLFDEVTVFAVISQSGSPGIQPGDFQGKVEQLNMIKNKSVDIVINTIVQ